MGVILPRQLLGDLSYRLIFGALVLYVRRDGFRDEHVSVCEYGHNSVKLSLADCRCTWSKDGMRGA